MSNLDRVAIVGIGCRFPGGARSPASFWELLVEGRDAIGPMPPGRFDAERFLGEPRTPGRIATSEGGFLEDIDGFDAGFFGLSPREAAKMDPQHRLLLEVAWESLEDAGIVPDTLAGRRVGVYAGIWTGEYENVLYRTPEELDFHALTGGGRYSASGRIAFALDLRGPTLTVDTGCSSALVSLHLAHQALRLGEIELAVVCAANLILQPHVNIGYSRSGMLSPGGRCRFGSAAPSGYVRSDGAAAVVLQRLGDARAEENRVRCAVLGTAVNADGRGSGQLATPSREAQAELLDLVYRESGVPAETLGYVEAHGTGTAAGDPAELGAIGDVLGRRRSADEPLFVGSVKTNIGHTEATAGLAGLVKAVLAVEHGTIPASLHADPRNEDIDWAGSHLAVPTENTPWPSWAEARAGVSSFGITGTNAHAILEAVDDPAAAEGDPPEDGPRVVCLSGRTDEALEAAVERLAEHLHAHPGVALEDVAHTANCRRTHHERRLALLVGSAEELGDALRECAGGTLPAGAVRGAAPLQGPRVGFVFSGQGSQWIGMGRELMGWAPAFARSIRASEEVLGKLVDWSLLDVLEGRAPMDRIDVIQPALGAVQMALAEQLKAWGVEPAAVVGHSMGEVAAAHAAGALGPEDALRILVTRSRLLATIAGAGAMALVDEEAERVERRLEEAGGRLSIAAVNGPRSTVVSGDPAAADALLEQLEGEGIFCRKVRVDVASHSAQTDPLLPELRRALDDMEPAAPAVDFYSTVLGGRHEEAPDAEYWVKNLRSPVRLDEAVQGMIEAGVDLMVEIAPHPVLLTSLGDIAAGRGATVAAHGLLRREEPEVDRMLEAAARLHVSGCPVDWRAVQEGVGRAIRLPTYPWQRERHWIDRWEDWSDGGRTSASVAWPEDAAQLLYEVQWVESPDADATAGSPGAAPGRWLLVGPESPVADAVELNWLARGHSVDRVSDVESPDRRKIREAVAASPAPLRGVVVVAGAAGSPADAAWRNCLLAKWSIQEGLEHSDDPFRLVLVTSGAAPVGAGDPAGDAAGEAGLGGSALWGFGRVVRDENPELEARIVDLDPEGEPGPAAAAVLAAAMGSADEPELALRGGRRYVPRLVRLAPPPKEQGRVPWPVEGATLITGGLGDLGMAAARHLVSQGVRRLVLLSRRGLPPRTEWSASDAESDEGRRVAGVLDLEGRGAAVHVAPVDVGDRAALDAFLEQYAAESWPPIRAVIHTAGVIDSHLVRSMPDEALESVFHGKARGAWNLHRALPEVERFVQFSSTSVVVPQAGEANYAGANAFLDALGALRAAAGVDAQVINWGVWENSGVIANEEGARYVEEVQRQGVGAMDPDVAVRIMDRIVASGARQIFAAPIDWARLRESRGEGHLGPLFSRVLEDGAGVPASAGARGGALDLLRADAPEDRPARVEDLLRHVAADVLGVAADKVKADATLGSQGLDSLMALELRNHVEGLFDLRVSATLAWNYPTIRKLSSHLLERCRTALGEPPPAPAAPAAPATGDEGPRPADGGARDADGGGDAAAALARHAAEVDALSDDEILRQLRGDA